jgi:nucleoside-diphosphate-sugar epimerase
MKRILLIGVTGFIGRQLVQQISKEQVEIFLLVRSKSKAIKMLKESGHLYEKRMKFVEGDLTRKCLGLHEDDLQQVIKSDVIIHAGGTMDISVTEQQATSSFLNGAKYVSELAESIHVTRGLEHFIHVIGYMSPFDNDNSNIEINVFQNAYQYIEIKNHYERTKFLADLYIRQQAKKVGYTVSVKQHYRNET